MRPETATRVIDRTIKRFMNDEPTAIYIPDMLVALKAMYVKQAIWHKDHGYDFSSDYTPDLDTDYENVEGEIMYISDRWNSPQRLQWLITGIEERKF